MSASDPYLVIEYSDDGGHTWSAEQWYRLGREGEYLNRVVLHRQGASYSRVYRLTYTEPTEFTIIAAHADVTIGT